MQALNNLLSKRYGVEGKGQFGYLGPDTVWTDPEKYQRYAEGMAVIHWS